MAARWARALNTVRTLCTTASRASWDDALLYGTGSRASARTSGSGVAAHGAVDADVFGNADLEKLDRWEAMQCDATGGSVRAEARVHLPTAALADWPALRAMAQAAGALGAKRAEHAVPHRISPRLSRVGVCMKRTEAVSDGAAGAQTHVPPAPAPAARPLPSAAPMDGGFTAESLSDPDAWLAAHAEALSADVSVASAPWDTPAEPRDLAHGVASADGEILHISCSAASDGDAATEAMAGCMAATLAVFDAARCAGHAAIIESIGIERDDS